MELSLFYDGAHFYEGDIIRIQFWKMGERITVTGRICNIDRDGMVIDYSEPCQSRRHNIDFDEITHVELIKGRL